MTTTPEKGYCLVKTIENKWGIAYFDGEHWWDDTNQDGTLKFRIEKDFITNWCNVPLNQTGKLKDKRKTAQAKCASCDTTFTFEKEDVKKDSPDKAMYVPCPLEQCGHRINVSDETYRILS